MKAIGPRSRKFSTYEMAAIAAASVPSVAEVRAAIQHARQRYGLTYGEIAAMICAPVNNVKAWSLGQKNPTGPTRHFLTLMLDGYAAEQRRAEKRNRQYLRRVARQAAAQSKGEPQDEMKG